MNDKTELFETMPLPKAFVKLCIPTILSSLVTVIYNIADTFFVGLLNDPIQTAAVTLAGTVLLAFNAINNLFGIGASSMLSRALGQKDYELARKSSAFGLYGSIFSGILFSILCIGFANPLLKLLGADSTTYRVTIDYMFWTVYLGATPAILNVVMAYLVRSEGAALHASIGTMGGCILNIILDPFFVMPWGLNMGAAGAGLATFISNLCACLYFLVLLYKKKNDTFISISPKNLTFERKIVKGVFSVGIPSAVQNLLNVVSMTVLNNFTSAYGVSAISAMGIAKKVDMVPMYIASGFSQGIMPLIGYTYASKMHQRMKDTIKMAFKIIMPIQFAGAFLYFVGAEFFIHMFIDNATVISYGSYFLRVLAFSIPFVAFDYTVVSIFQAQGNGKIPFIIAVLRKGVLDIPLMIALNMLFPLYGIPYSQIITQVVLCVAEIFILRKSFSKCIE